MKLLNGMSISLARMGWWQWVCLGVLLGLLGLWIYGSRGVVPRDPKERVSAEEFRTELLMPPLAGGQARVGDIYLYPEHEGVRLITYVLTSPQGSGTVSEKHFLYLHTGKSFTEKVSQIAAHSPAASVSVRMWNPTIRSVALWMGSAVLVFGVVCPMLIRALMRAGLGPKLPPPVGMPKVQIVMGSMGMEMPDMPKPQTPDQNATSGAASPAPRSLSGQALEVEQAPVEEDDKHYRGEFYPIEDRRNKPKGFTLVELLIVIGIIGILMSILLPTLSAARIASDRLVCAANLRSIGQGMLIYLDENAGTFPAAYAYVDQTLSGNQETGDPSAGYVHWSSYLLGTNSVPEGAFHCPDLTRGGLQPTDTTPDNLDPGTVSANPGIIDKQVPRSSYTVNEAICPRNKFVVGFQGAVRRYTYVRASQVAASSQTILATEWGQNGALQGSTATGVVVYSHRPVHGFVGVDGTLEMLALDPNTAFREVTAADLDPDPSSMSASTTSMSRLDWVGRNHGRFTGYPDMRLTNFLYVDGHVESKSIYETLMPFEWGKQFYSLVPNGDMLPPQP